MGKSVNSLGREKRQRLPASLVKCSAALEGRKGLPRPSMEILGKVATAESYMQSLVGKKGTSEPACESASSSYLCRPHSGGT